ncbi:MAG: ABC transporter ATP-binding protein [Proteobacteria bacterium]|nr:ABC transporter ATP-binding protein [Pseudomonadota bacterium]
MHDPSDILLCVRDLQVHFGSPAQPVRAVDGVSFDIRRGESFALLGESGCGKSVTALSILQLVPAPAGRIAGGEVWFDGTDLLGQSELQMRQIRGSRISMIFQEPMTSLNPVMTVGEQISEVLQQHLDLRGRAGRERSIELLDAVGLPAPARRIGDYPHQLSGGMKQRVMIAMALAGEPDLLIADEPTTALDVTIQAQVLELLARLQQDTGMAILFITHDLGVVADTMDHVAVMYAGQVVEKAARGAFFAQPLHPYSRKLFAAVPGGHKRGQLLETIRGSVPPLDRKFTACRFVERCDEAWLRCHEQLPPWIEQSAEGESHGVRCLRYAPDIDVPAVTPGSVAVVKDSAASASRDGSLVRVRDLKVHFPITKGLFHRAVGQVYAVDGVDLDIASGRTVALVGESGCGKTTAGKAILQLIRPTSGTVHYRDQDLTRLTGKALRQQRAHMQIIFQDPFSSMDPRMLVRNILEEGIRAQAIATRAEQRQTRVESLLAHVGLPVSAAKRYPHEFSGGQRQRIAIARALAVNPGFIVCDEPTSALDVSVQAQTLNLLKELQAKMGLSYLFITHNLSVVDYLAHEVAVMYLGRIVEQGRVADIMQDPLHPYTQALLSAVPTIDKAAGREVIRLAGELPSPINPPRGCHFHPRCPQAMPECQQAYPDLTLLDNMHQVRCFLYPAN